MPWTHLMSITGTAFVGPITGDGVATTFTVTHNLGTLNVDYSIRENLTGAIAPGLGPAVTATDANNVSVEFATAPANGDVYTIKIRG